MTTQERFFEIDVQVHSVAFFSKAWRCPYQSSMAYHICRALCRQHYPVIVQAYVTWDRGWLQIFYDEDAT